MIQIATAEHGPGIAVIYGPHVETGVSSFETVPPTGEEMGQRVVKTTSHTPWLVMLEGDMVTGYAYSNKHRWREAYRWAVEVSVYVHPEYQRRGVAYHLYSALFDLLRAQNIHQALAGIVVPNDPSVAFHASMGFEQIARYKEIGHKFGQWWDTIWMQKFLSDVAIPEEFIPFSKLDKQVIQSILDQDRGKKKG